MHPNAKEAGAETDAPLSGELLPNSAAMSCDARRHSESSFQAKVDKSIKLAAGMAEAVAF